MTQELISFDVRADFSGGAPKIVRNLPQQAAVLNFLGFELIWRPRLWVTDFSGYGSAP